MVSHGKSQYKSSVKASLEGSILAQVDEFLYLGIPINDRLDLGEVSRRLQHEQNENFL